MWFFFSLFILKKNQEMKIYNFHKDRFTILTCLAFFSFFNIGFVYFFCCASPQHPHGNFTGFSWWWLSIVRWSTWLSLPLIPFCSYGPTSKLGAAPWFLRGFYSEGSCDRHYNKVQQTEAVSGSFLTLSKSPAPGWYIWRMPFPGCSQSPFPAERVLLWVSGMG